MEENTKPKLVLELGGTYATRDGKHLVKLSSYIDNNSPNPFKWQGTINVEPKAYKGLWNKTGHYISNTVPDEWDLIERVAENATRG